MLYLSIVSVIATVVVGMPSLDFGEGDGRTGTETKQCSL